MDFEVNIKLILELDSLKHSKLVCYMDIEIYSKISGIINLSCIKMQIMQLKSHQIRFDDKDGSILVCYMNIEIYLDKNWDLIISYVYKCKLYTVEVTPN